MDWGTIIQFKIRIKEFETQVLELERDLYEFFKDEFGCNDDQAYGYVKDRTKLVDTSKEQFKQSEKDFVNKRVDMIYQIESKINAFKLNERDGLTDCLK